MALARHRHRRHRAAPAPDDSRTDRLGDQVSGRNDRLTDIVAAIDRRLASLEGRITGWQDRPHGPAA